MRRSLNLKMFCFLYVGSMYRWHLLISVIVMPFTLIMLVAYTYAGRVPWAIGFGVMALFWLVLDYQLWRRADYLSYIRLDAARSEGWLAGRRGRQ